MKTRIAICILLFLIIENSFAQELKKPLYIGIKGHVYGTIIPHRDTLNDIASSTPRGVQLELSSFNISEDAWLQCNCFAKTGVQLAYYNFGNPRELGHSLNAIIFLEPIINPRGRLNFSFRAGFGLTYLNRVFDKEENPRNLFYSSHLSNIMLIALQANYQINKKWSANLGAQYNHISNGGIRQPNLGMNYPMVNLGVDYIINAPDEIPDYKKKGFEDKKDNWYFRFSYSIKTIPSEDSLDSEPQRPVYGIEFGYLKRLSRLSAISLGTEILYDHSWRYRINSFGPNDFDYRTINFLIGHNFMMGKFIFNQQMGIYAYKNFPNGEGLFYQRFGLFYTIGNYLNLGFTMKSHLEVAEIMDVRLGVLF